MSAKIMTINFEKAADIRHHSSGSVIDSGHQGDSRPRTADGKLLTDKQIRARARRKAQKTSKNARNSEIISQIEFETLYKPVDEWDLEELARGRPRDATGQFRGRAPKWITREVHEKAMERFQLVIKQEMGRHGLTALDTIAYVLDNTEVDHRGKPVVSAATKFQASAFLLEHIIGKPKQRVEQDISVKLQGILGSVMVNPNLAADGEGNSYGELPSSTGDGFQLGHYPGHTIPIGVAETEEDIVEGEFADG